MKYLWIAGCLALAIVGCKGTEKMSETVQEEATMESSPALLNFVGQGNEPGWNVKITDETIVYTSLTNPTGFTFTGVQRNAIMDVAGVGYSGSDQEGNSIRVEAFKDKCKDTMMEKVWPYRVRVELTVASGAEMSENAIEGCGEFYEDERLDGTWFLVSFKGQELPTVKKDKSPIISFNTEKNLMNANMGCNGIGGAYELMENTMYFNPNFMSTQMYCEGLMGLEKDFSKAIAGKTFKYSFLGKNVVFSTMDGVDVLILKHK